MVKGRKQTAEELVRRYSEETVSLEAAAAPTEPGVRRADPLLESLRRNVNRVVMIPVSILAIEENVRQTVDEQSPEFLALTDSVREQGVRQNIIVDLQDGDENGFRVVVIAGQRRTLAARRAGVGQIAALVLRLGSRGDRLIEGLAENLLREDLHCLDQADAYAALIGEGWTEEHLAEKFERRKRTILQFLRLARYPERAKRIIRANRDLFTTGLLFNRFIARSWKREDDLIRALLEVVEGKPPAAGTLTTEPPEISRLVETVSRFNGLRCRVKGNSEKGRIILSYQSRAALEKVLALFDER